MKAIRVHEVGGPDVLRFETLPDPEPGTGQVLIRVARVGLNYADTNIRRGRYALQPALPYVPGFEVAGHVAAIGAGVPGDRFPIGSRVSALTMGGGYAELAVARATHTIPLPDSLTLDQAAGFPWQGLTAYHVLTTMGRLQPGETVVVQAGAGGVGTMAIQLARIFRAGRVIATAGGPGKVKLAREVGADDAIDYLRESFPARVNEITERRGADLILESVGGQVLERSVECLAVLGRLITFGNASGTQADLDSLWPRLRIRCQSLIGFYLGAVLERAALRDESIAHLLQLIVERRLRVVIGKCFDLDEAGPAQAALEDRRTTGKILLRVRSDVE